MERQETKKTEEREAFSELDRDMTIQSQVSNLQVNKSIVYVTTHEWKAPINKLSRSNKPKIQQVEGFAYVRITSDL